MPYMEMRSCERGFAILGKLALASFCFLMSFGLASGQSPVTEDEKGAMQIKAQAYETQQRAKRLLQLDAEIRSLPDADVRGQLRFNILEFIYTNQARSEYADAEFLLTTFFEDLAANQDEVAHRAGFWRNSLALMLRKQAPETAKRIEAKYVPVVDTSAQDQQELRNPKADKKAIIDRAIDRVRSEKSILGILGLFETVRREDKKGAERILMAVLDRAETDPSPEIANVLYRLIDARLNEPPFETSQANITRYYRSLVAGAQIELSQSKPNVYMWTVMPLRRTLPKIKLHDPQLYAEAQAAIERYRKTLSEDSLAKEEGADRIEASGDKLRQTIAEAEAAKAQQVKDYFWAWAASLAVQKEDYWLATDLMMKASPNLSNTNRPNGRDEDIYFRVVNSALRKRNHDAANLAIDKIQDRLVRAKAMLELGFEYGLWGKDRDHAVEIITNALELMELTAPDADSICRMGNVRTIYTLTGRSHLISQIFTQRMVNMINRIPTNGIDAKPGTPERAEFVKMNLARALICVGSIFRPVSNGKVIPDPSLASQITVREWRLAALIEAEKARKYTFNQSPTGK